MKTFTLWTIILTLFICCASSLTLVSCSTENESANSKEGTIGQSSLPSTVVQRKTGLYPENAANDYDAAGQLHNDISESYLANGLVPTTTAAAIQQVQAIANSNIEYQSLVPSNYVSPTATRIDYIMNNQQSSTLDIIANSGMSLRAKLSLTTFLNTVMEYKSQGKDIDYLYPFIIDYETNTISDPALTAMDRKVILTTTSITRYGFYFAQKHRRKPRDRDWDISWGNIVAGTEGSSESSAKAIMMATVAGILSNK